MLRGRLFALSAHKDHFRWRGTDVTRIEGLSDGVFGFGITLLAVSLDVPKRFDQLLVALYGLPAFAVSFVLLFGVWRRQYLFFRRFGLEDRATTWLNAILLMIVLAYIYPLKFLYGFLGELVRTHFASTGSWAIDSRQVPILLGVFLAGFAALSLVFCLLYAHALAQREALELTPEEAARTRDEMQFQGLLTALLLGVAAVSLRRPELAGVVGGPGIAVIALVHKATRKRRATPRA